MDGRRGLQVRVPPLSGTRMAIRTLKEHSFFQEAPRQFNSLPDHLRTLKGSLETFKHNLDKYLEKIPDTPLDGIRPVFATDSNGAQTNSLRHWIKSLDGNSYNLYLHSIYMGTSDRDGTLHY